MNRIREFRGLKCEDEAEEEDEDEGRKNSRRMRKGGERKR